MKKYLLHIVLFFSIVAVSDLVFGLACEWLQQHAKGGRMKGVQQTAMVQTADVVIMGSSRAHHHYVSSVLAETTGLTVHNSGVDGNGIVLATGLYDLLSERYIPKVIIYDVEPAFDINVYSEDGNNTRYIGWLRPYFYHPKVKKTICRVDPSERYKDLSALFRYNGKIADLLKDQVILSDFTIDGYAPLQGEMKTGPIRKSSDENVQLDTLKLNMMTEFISRISKSETRLIMVASPKYRVGTSEVFSPIKQLCNQYGVEFWDYYSSELFQRKDFFKEKMHMNDKGAHAFSERLGTELKTFLE